MYKRLCRNIKALKSNILSSLVLNDEAGDSRKNIAFSNYTAGTINNLVGANFLTGFLLLFNAGDSFMGFVAMAGFIGNLFQIFSPLILERFQSRKKMLILSRAATYSLNIVVIGLIPFIPVSDAVKLMIILVIILSVNLVNALFAPGFAVWHIKSIPENMRARYFSFFTITNGIVIYTIVLVSSKIVDYFKSAGNEMGGLLFLRAVAFLLCIADIFFMTKIKEYPNERSETAINPINILLNPFKEKKYLITVFIACLWNYSANIPGPYFTMYMLKDVGVSYSFLSAISMFNIPALILLTPLWRKRVNSTSWFRALCFSMGLFLLNYIGLSFVTGRTLVLYPISVIFSFLVVPGINLVFSNIPYINIPEKDQTNYIGFYSSMNNLAALLGVLTGKEFIRLTEERTISLLGITMQNKQYILLLTASAMLIAVILIYILQKKSEKTFSVKRTDLFSSKDIQ